jgi:PAS domain S-box-containing protein
MERPKRKRSAAHARVSARSRIALGLVFLLVSVLWLATAIGIVPSERAAAMSARAQFCEAVAVFSSVMVQKGDHVGLARALEGMVARDPDVLSAGVRRASGQFLAEVGDHRGQWDRLSGQAALESYIQVPIFAGSERWGTAELRFRPISREGVLGYLHAPQVKLVLFVASACMGLYLLYLRKMLQHLDPAKAVPSRVRSALDTLAEGLMVLDNYERVVLANQTFATLVGRPPEDLLGVRADTFSWVRGDAAGPTAELPWTAAVRTGTASRGVSLRLADAAGVVRTFVANCSPVLGHDGRYRGVLVSLDDVTKLEAQEQELRKARDAADAASQAKSEFLARMSHEIRTPMNAILGFADVLRRGFEEDAARRAEYLQTIHASGRHLLELINDILDLSKIEAGKMEVERVRCSPVALLAEVAAVLSGRAAEKGLALTVEWDGPAPATVLTDPTRLRQAVTNLVGNAIKFTPTGSVQVRAALLSEGPEPRLRVRVVDTGVGMKPDVLDRIFTPFAQADSSVTRQYGGTGLGLSISKQIAVALGGTLTVTSEYGRGSTFTLELPPGPLDGVALIDAAAAGGAVAGSRPVAAAPLADLRGVRVLLVEDGESNRKLATLVLARAGATVDYAEDGRQGVDRALAGRYDVVLMDMQMPVMDGYSAARLLRREGYAGPILALTAHAMRGDEERCRDAGCSGFLTKPIDMDLMVRTVREAAGDLGRSAEANPADAAVDHSRPARATTCGQQSAAAPAGTPSVADPTGAPRPPEGPLVSSLPSDDPDFAEIIVEFVDRLHERLGEMQAAWSAEDWAKLAELSHWVKGSGGTAGFHDLTAPARGLEAASRERRLADVAAGIDELRRLADRMVAPRVKPAIVSAD